MAHRITCCTVHGCPLNHTGDSREDIIRKHGLERNRRFSKTSIGRVAQKRHRESLAGRARQKRWQQSERGRAHIRKINAKRSAYKLAWSQAHPEGARQNCANRRATQRGLTIAGFGKEIDQIYSRSQELRKWFKVCVDHIIPLSKGGMHHPGNLQIIYEKENLRKGPRLNYSPPSSGRTSVGECVLTLLAVRMIRTRVAIGVDGCISSINHPFV